MTDSTGFDRKSFFLSIVFSLILLLSAGMISIYIIADKSIREVQLLSNAIEAIDKNYHEKVDWDSMISHARDAMFAKLDRYSSYYQHQQFDQLDEEMSGSYTGVGISVLWHEQGLLIMSVRENGPAYNAGLLTGDIITKADSIVLADLNSSASSTLLRGEENSSVNVEIFRPSTEKTFSLSIVRKKINFVHIPFAGLTQDSIVYIRLLDFDFGATDDLQAALDSLVLQAEIKPKGVILDLQGNPGGLFSEAYKTADLFLDEGFLIVGTDGRSRWKDVSYYSSGHDVTSGLPLVLLVDKGSASSSEIVSGALQTAGRAFLVGDTTFGKGLVQGFVQFPNGDGVKLTISRYYFSDSTYLNDFDSTLNEIGHGLVPDYYFNKADYDYFTRQLENNFLLGKFAALHQDALINDYAEKNLNDIWIDKFEQYVKDQNSVIFSYRTEIAQLLSEIAEEENLSSKTIQVTKSILNKSKRYDKNNFMSHAQYIKNRLIQTATQRKDGEYQMYKNVLLESRPEIKFAADILLEQKL